MKNFKFSVYLLFIVIAVYFSQGWLYERGNIVSQSMLVLWIIIDVFCFFRVVFKGMEGGFGWLLIIFGVIMFFNWLLFEKTVVSSEVWRVNTVNDLKNIFVFVLSYFPFKLFADNRIISSKDIRFFFWILLIVFIMTYLSNESYLQEIKGLEEATNNNAFTFVLLFPLMGLFFEKKHKYLLVFVMLYFVILGAKRGAWLCYLVELILFFFFVFRSFTKRQRSLGFIGLLVGVVIVLVFIKVLYNSDEFVQYRFDMLLSGEDSGRSNIWNALLVGFLDSSIIQIVFGHGMDSTIAIAGMYAHNDWYQLLIDSGIVGVVIYFLMFISLYRFYSKNKCYLSDNVKFMYLSAVLCWFLKSLFSMGYTSPFSFLLLLPIAYTQSVVKHKKQELCSQSQPT